MLQPYCIPNIIEAGCDEAGRGPLAGSVFAAAVILPQNFMWSEEGLYLASQLNDSKQLSESKRYALRPLIESFALAWAVAETTPREIDEINILNSSILAMHRALSMLSVRPEHILVDGNKWKPYIPPNDIMEIPARTVVKGDAKYMSIAAASILAKTYRDDYMCRIDAEYPQYGWRQNKGYPTQAHYAALAQFGVSPYHRLTFRLSSDDRLT